MKAYIGISYAHRFDMSSILDAIQEVCFEIGIVPLVYVRKQSNSASEMDMMADALEELRSSELLIVEVSQKAIGIGIEVGYAKALGKMIIYVHSESAERSTTVGGIADAEVTYRTTGDLRQKLLTTLKTLSPEL